MDQHWKSSDKEALARALTYKELAGVALAVLARMPQPVGQVCGPLTSGGYGSLSENLGYFEEAIRKLQGEGRIIFNQLPFLVYLKHITTTPYHKGPEHLLEEFYGPIFESGLVKKLHFMHAWATSHGARWEYARAMRLGIEIKFLDPL